MFADFGCLKKVNRDHKGKSQREAGEQFRSAPRNVSAGYNPPPRPHRNN